VLVTIYLASEHLDGLVEGQETRRTCEISLNILARTIRLLGSKLVGLNDRLPAHLNEVINVSITTL
jgi:hypothetical protein